MGRGWSGRGGGMGVGEVKLSFILVLFRKGWVGEGLGKWGVIFLG